MRSKQFQRKSKPTFCGLAMAALLHFGAFACSAQTTEYDYTGSETNVTLNPGTYIITAYGAPGGDGYYSGDGGLGAEMSAEFNFSASTNLTLLVGGGGYYFDYAIEPSYSYYGGGGGGGSFVVEGSTPLVVAGGGGGAAGGGPPYGSIADYHSAGGGNGTTANASSGGGNVGGSGGTGSSGGTGAYQIGNLNGGVDGNGGGAGGGGGFYGDGGIGNYYYFEGDALGGSSFEDGGAGGLGNFRVVNTFDGTYFGSGGYGGGGGGFTSQNFGCGGGGGGYSGGGGGGEVIYSDSFGAGGGGGSFIDPSAIAILAEVSGIASPDDPPYELFNGNGEIFITALPEPASARLLAIGSLALLRRIRRGRSVESTKLGSSIEPNKKEIPDEI